MGFDGGGFALPGERPITVNAAAWRSVLPADAWPGGLGAGGLGAGGLGADGLGADGFGAGGRVWRRDVFAVAGAWRAGVVTSRQLLTAVLAWGHGPNGYGAWRAGRALGGDPDGSRLDRVLEPLRRDPPAGIDALGEAYRALRDRMRDRLPWLGPAFFTKLLYFAGYRRGVDSVQPLILDRLVAGELPAEAGPAGGRRGEWTSVEWLTYLEWARARASAEGVEPDEVEFALFRRANERR